MDGWCRDRDLDKSSLGRQRETCRQCGSHLMLLRQGIKSWGLGLDSGEGRSVGLRMPLIER